MVLLFDTVAVKRGEIDGHGVHLWCENDAEDHEADDDDGERGGRVVEVSCYCPDEKCENLFISVSAA